MIDFNNANAITLIETYEKFCKEQNQKPFYCQLPELPKTYISLGSITTTTVTPGTGTTTTTTI